MRSGNTARKRRLRGEKVAKEGMTFCFDFDGLRVKSVSTSETSVRVFRIENLSTTPRDSEKNHENSTVELNSFSGKKIFLEESGCRINDGFILRAPVYIIFQPYIYIIILLLTC